MHHLGIREIPVYLHFQILFELKNWTNIILNIAFNARTIVFKTVGHFFNGNSTNQTK